MRQFDIALAEREFVLQVFQLVQTQLPPPLERKPLLPKRFSSFVLPPDTGVCRSSFGCRFPR